MGGLLTAPLVVFDYFSNAMTLLGWIINNAIWNVMVGTGIALERAARRSQGASQGETFRPDAALDGRGRPVSEEGGD